MNRKTYERIALSTLPLTFVGAYFVGRPLAEWLASFDDEVGALLSLLGYVLALLACVLVWAVALLPLRRRAGFKPIAVELRELKNGDFAEAYAREQAAIRARETSQDPAVRARQHFDFALIGAVFSAGALALTWALWEDGWIWTTVLAAAIVCPALTVYHLARGIRFRRRAARSAGQP